MKIITLFLLSLSTLSFAQTADDYIYDQTNELTDAETAQSESYIHQGLAEKEYMEKCVDEETGEINKECTESREAFKGGLGADLEKWMPMVSQAYSMFNLIPGFGQIPHNVKSANGDKLYTDGKETYGLDKANNNTPYKLGKDGAQTPVEGGALPDGAKRKTENKKDYCGMIPMLSEMAAKVTSESQNSQIEDNIQNSEGSSAQQAQAFYAMADVQKNLAKTSTFQAAGWTATAGCYTAMMLTDTINAKSANAIIKVSAAALLGTFYIKKVSAHKDRARAYEELAKGFPQPGDCNPHTNTSCFCHEETSVRSDPQNFAKYCTPKGFHSAAPNAMSCITKNLQPDPSCSCKARGTCVQATLANVGRQIGLSPSIMNLPMKALKPLSSGFTGSNFGAGTNKNLAITKKRLKKIKPTAVSFKNKGQKDLAKQMVEAGLPKFAAVKLATTKGEFSAPSSVRSSLSPRNYSRRAVSKRNYNKKPKFTRGSTIRGKSKYSKSRSRSRSRSRGGAKAVEIQDFSSKAQRAAMEKMISKDKSRPIFDIITYRYKVSGWRELQENMNKELKEAKE